MATCKYRYIALHLYSTWVPKRVGINQEGPNQHDILIRNSGMVRIGAITPTTPSLYICIYICMYEGVLIVLSVIRKETNYSTKLGIYSTYSP
jgi:hypothetical protein